MRILCVRLEDDIYERLQHLASETRRTKSYYVREVLFTGLNEFEDIYLREKDVKATACPNR